MMPGRWGSRFCRLCDYVCSVLYVFCWFDIFDLCISKMCIASLPTKDLLWNLVGFCCHLSPPRLVMQSIPLDGFQGEFHFPTQHLQFWYYPSSNNHGSEKWVPQIVVTLEVHPVATSPKNMEERVVLREGCVFHHRICTKSQECLWKYYTSIERTLSTWICGSKNPRVSVHIFFLR